MNVVEDRPCDATLIWTHDGEAQFVKGTLLEEEGSLRLKTAQSSRPRIQERCILSLEGSPPKRMTATVTGFDDEMVLLDPGRPYVQRRYYPRVDTPAAFLFRVVDPGPNAQGWNPLILETLRNWIRPSSPELNLSVDGVAFWSRQQLPAGARIEIELDTGEADEDALLFKGVVVRSALEMAESGSEEYRIAVHFDSLSPAEHDALFDYTIRAQQALFDELEAPQLMH